MSGTADAPAKSDDNSESPEQSSSRRGRRSWVIEFIVLVAVALAIATTVKTYLLQPFVIPSGSMENTLLIGDKVLVNKLIGDFSPIRRGEIIVFNGTGSWDPPSAASSNPLVRIYRSFLGLFGAERGQVDYIKRVIGLPGDHVRCCNAQGLLTVNGVALHESSYLYPGSAPSTVRFSIVVPPGRLWVMGDNRELSADSRSHDCEIGGDYCRSWDRNGTIPESMVIGRAFLVVWPLSRFKVLSVPSTFNQQGISADEPNTSGRATLGRTTGAVSMPSRAIPAEPAMALTVGVFIAAPVTILERKFRLRVARRLKCDLSVSSTSPGS